MPSKFVIKDGVRGYQPVVQPGVVNWLQVSAEPGEGGNVVLYGHNTDVFKNLYKITPSTVITITWVNGDYGYVVDRVLIVDESGSAQDQAKNGRLIEPTNWEQLTLVTCYGEKKRLIVIAYPR
jgi:sortase (surface protein transpeptidase)